MKLLENVTYIDFLYILFLELLPFVSVESVSEIPAFMMYTRCGALTSNVNYHRSQIDRSVNIYDSYFNLNNINSATYAKVLKINSQNIYACAGYPDQRIISP